MSVSQIIENDQAWRVLKLSEEPKMFAQLMTHADLLPERHNLKHKDEREHFFKVVDQIKNLIAIAPQKAALDEAFSQPGVAAAKKLDLTDMMKPRLTELLGEKGFSIMVYDAVKEIGKVSKKGAAALYKKEAALREELKALAEKNKEFRLGVDGYKVVRGKDFFNPEDSGQYAFTLQGDMTKKAKEKNREYYKQFGSARRFLERSAEVTVMLKTISAVKAGNWETKDFIAEMAATKVEDIIPDHAEAKTYAEAKGLKNLRGLVDQANKNTGKIASTAESVRLKAALDKQAGSGK